MTTALLVIIVAALVAIWRTLDEVRGLLGLTLERQARLDADRADRRAARAAKQQQIADARQRQTAADNASHRPQRLIQAPAADDPWRRPRLSDSWRRPESSPVAEEP